MFLKVIQEGLIHLPIKKKILVIQKLIMPTPNSDDIGNIRPNSRNANL
jgi:hypothetical protein